jgi:uncharacterized membrane protein
MRLPTRLISVFALIIFLIVVLPMLFLGSYTVRSEETESLGIFGLLEGMQKNYIIMIVLAIIAISVIVVWAFVIFNITPK